MREIKADELKQVEFNLLVKVDSICKENGWECFLSGGTLLGAIRHKGFIPWDDDIDISMKRDDYDAFLKYVMQNGASEGLSVISAETNKSYSYLFAKVCDANTVMIEENFNRDDCGMGVYVDVFPIDGLGAKSEAIKNFQATRFERELLVARNWRRFFRSKTHAWYIEPIRFAFWIMSRFVSPQKLIKKVERYYAKFPIANSENVAVVCGAYREKEIIPAEIIAGSVEVEFEGKKFLAFADYDKYLNSIYGDYMQLPPEDKRISHHMFKAYWKD